jgi:hypothetical protein
MPFDELTTITHTYSPPCQQSAPLGPGPGPQEDRTQLPLISPQTESLAPLVRQKAHFRNASLYCFFGVRQQLFAARDNTHGVEKCEYLRASPFSGAT